MIFFTCAQIFVCKLIIKLSLFSITPLAMFCHVMQHFNFILFYYVILFSVKKKWWIESLLVYIFYFWSVCHYIVNEQDKSEVVVWGSEIL